MSRVISVALASHLAGEVTTLAECWKVRRADGTVYGFTDHDQDIPGGSIAGLLDGVTYLAATSFNASAIETTSAFAVDNMDIQGVLSSDMISEADLLAGRWDHAEVWVFLVNWADLSQGIMKLRRGTMGQVSTERGEFSAELRGLLQRLQQTVGQICSPTCRADLGDARCKKDLTSFTFTGSVTTVASRRVFTSAALTQADDYFTYGKITWTSGANDGLSMEIKGFTAASDQVELQLPMPFDIATSDTFIIVAGCDRSRQTCHDKFDNVINMHGEPDLPGLDKVLQFGKNGV